jgi:hypothetical protein
MIAALLPLPPNPRLQMMEREEHNGHNRFRPADFTYQLRAIDETRYESARWWRNLNRFMSFVGLVIIAAIIALVVVGIKQGWMVVRSSS